MNNDDGFCHRLILYAPEDSTHDGDAIMNAEQSEVSFCSLFLFIYLIHCKTVRRYTFTEQATVILQHEFNKYHNLKKLAQECDYTIA